MIAGIIAGGNRWPRLAYNKVTYMTTESHAIGANSTEVLININDSMSIDVLRRVNDVWEVVGSISPPVPVLYFGYAFVVSDSQLAVRAYTLEYASVLYLYEKVGGVWVYRQVLTDVSFAPVVFAGNGSLVSLDVQNLKTLQKLETGWATSWAIQSLSAHLHPEMYPMSGARIQNAGGTIILAFSRTGPSNGSYLPTYVTILPITWTGASWSVGASISTADGIEAFTPLAATAGRALFLHEHYGVIPNDELVEYNVVNGDLVYGHTLTPPPIVDDPITPGSGWPFDPSGYGIRHAVYMGSRLLIAASGYTRLIWGYNLGASSSSLAYTTKTRDPISTEGPSSIVAGGDYFAAAYEEGEHIPDEWGGYVEPDRVSIYITT